jgi:hypothetical protein
VSADYSQGDNGTKTALALAPAQGFSLLSLPPRKGGAPKVEIGMWAGLSSKVVDGLVAALRSQ